MIQLPDTWTGRSDDTVTGHLDRVDRAVRCYSYLDRAGRTVR